MIIDLPNTTTSKISKALVTLRDEGGATALGRVLTLIIVAPEGKIEDALIAANDASREHPMRILAIAQGDESSQTPLDAQIRVGGDAGASEVIVLRARGEAAHYLEELVTGLILPDTPVVTWWTHESPSPVASSPLGRISQRRITDSATAEDAVKHLAKLSQGYSPGDTDLAWTRITLWRAQLAATLDQPPFLPITKIEVASAENAPSGLLLQAWLEHSLGLRASRFTIPAVANLGGIHGVRLHRDNGVISFERTDHTTVEVKQPGQPAQTINLPKRELSDSIAEELRRLDADSRFGLILTQAVPLLIAADKE